MSDMCFGVSEHIASKFPPADVSEIVKFLARKHVNEFKLQDILDLPIATENAQPILDEFTKLRVVKPAIRYFCPTHQDDALKLRKSVIVTRKGHCHRCGKAHLLQDLETENYYRRIKVPGSWSNDDTLTTQSTEHQREPPLWKDRRLHIALIPALIVAAVALFTHFSEPDYRIPAQLATPKSTAPTTIVQTKPSSTLTSFATPMITTTATAPPVSGVVSPS